MQEQANSFPEFGHFFQLNLDLFSGPIDLLLHLVKSRELPIEKVSLAEVCDQYLTCVDAVTSFDLDLAGEYLVIAATLLSIKASVLLGEPVVFEKDDDGNLFDPHEELLKKLREAQIYRDSAAKLGEMDFFGLDVFASPGLMSRVEAPDAGYQDHDPQLLGKALRKLLERAAKGAPIEIKFDPVSIVQRMMEVLDHLNKEGGNLEFERLIPDLSSRGSIIQTFLALLELCKRQLICVKQDANFERIFVVLVTSQEQAASTEAISSEFDAEPEAEDEAAALANA